MSRYLHKLFEGEARRFYRSHVQNECISYKSYKSSKSKMESELNSNTRQRRVGQYLQALHLNEIREN